MPDTTRPQTTPEVADRLGITFRQLDYWVRSGRLRTAYIRPGSGVVRLWSPDEIQQAAVFAALVRAGVSLNAIADGLDTLASGPGWFAIRLGDGDVLVTGHLP